MTEDVEVPAGSEARNNNDSASYHTDPDCHRLYGVETTTETRKYAEDQLGLTECGICATGHNSQKHQSNAHLNALKNADASEI